MFHLACVLCMSLFCGLALSAAPTFEGNVRVNCGGVYTEDEGTFQSPGRPRRRYCVYEISVMPRRKISLQFPTFHIKPRGRRRGTRPGRCLDSLILYDGDDLIGGPFCGQEIAPDRVFTSKTRKMTVFFRSRDLRYPGFTATYSSTLQCGVPGRRQRRSTGNKIVGGEEAAPGSYPWQVFLRVRYPSGGDHFCGGALLNEYWVVTAAQCVVGWDPSDISVVLGEHSLSIPSPQEKDYEVLDIESRSDYNSYTYDNDIALLRLKGPVSLNDYVMPICLPEATFAVDEGTDLTVTGWGATSEGGLTSDYLQEVVVSFITGAECTFVYGGNINPDTTICAGDREGGKDACHGDSGGPLMYFPSGGPAVLAGIVSWGEGCARPDYPGVYTRVSKYVYWIQEIMDKNP